MAGGGGLESQYTPYALFLFVAAAVVLGLAAYLVRYRAAPGAAALAAMLVGLRPGDCAARFGGDEFTAFLEGISSIEEAAAVARRIESRLREPFVVEGRRVEVGVSIGVVASGRAPSADSAKSLMHKADLAMYGAKNDGKAGLQVFIAGPWTPDAKLYVVPLDRERRTGTESGETHINGGVSRSESEGPDSAPDLELPQA